MVAPPWYAVPPAGYGGIELVVYLLSRELKNRGHDVTVFSCHGSDAEFRVVSLADDDWAQDLGTPEQRVREATYLRRVYQYLKRDHFDIVHEHNEYPGIMLAHTLHVPFPVIATVHGYVGPKERTFLREVDREIGLVAISDAQKAGAPDVNWDAMVHNAVDLDQLRLENKKQDYLVELARISPQKGQHIAIQVARRAGKPLVLAGKLDADPQARAYFESQIQPHLGNGVEWIENVAGDEKKELLANASAMLFPILWEEPFGLAMVEAMASGTPVIAFARGAAMELVVPGVSGFLGETVEDLVALVDRAGDIDPARCRESVSDRFGPERMADEYESAYELAMSRYLEPFVPGPTLDLAGND